MQEYLNKTFSEKWIGRGLITLPALIEWPARSLDFTTSDNSIWGYIKDIVFKQRYHSKDELKAVFTAAFGTLTHTILRKMSS